MKMNGNEWGIEQVTRDVTVPPLLEPSLEATTNESAGTRGYQSVDPGRKWYDNLESSATAAVDCHEQRKPVSEPAS